MHLHPGHTVEEEDQSQKHCSEKPHRASPTRSNQAQQRVSLQRFFFIKPVSQQLSVKQPPGQLLLQGTTPLSLSLPWTSVPSHPSHHISTIPVKILSPVSQFPHGSVLAALSRFLPAWHMKHNLCKTFPCSSKLCSRKQSPGEKLWMRLEPL